MELVKHMQATMGCVAKNCKQQRAELQKKQKQYITDLMKLLNSKSQDKENRMRLNKNIKIKQPYDDIIVSKDTKEYIKEASEYVLKNFPKNPGNVDNFIYPITRQNSLKWLKHFIKNKLKNLTVACEESGADVIVSGNIGCITHLQQDEKPVLHWIEIVDQLISQQVRSK